MKLHPSDALSQIQRKVAMQYRVVNYSLALHSRDFQCPSSEQGHELCPFFIYQIYSALLMALILVRDMKDSRPFLLLEAFTERVNFVALILDARCNCFKPI